MFKSLPQSTQAVLIAILAYGSFSHADVLTKILTQVHSPSTCLSFVALLGIIISASWILIGRGINGFKTQKWKLHLIRAAVIALSSFAAVSAIKALPLPVFYSIVFVSPVTLILVVALLGHEKLAIHRLLCAIVAFIGVLIIVGPQYHDLGPGIIFAFICMACSTVGVLLSRRIGHQDYLPVYSLFPLVVILLVNAPFADWSAAALGNPLLWMFTVSAVLILVGHIGVPISYARAPEASLVAPVFYTQMLWGVLYGFLVFDRIPTPYTIAGAALIITSGLYIVFHERRQRRSPVNKYQIEREDF